jgi:SagB-type dehydrogenase family enzyme
MTVLRRYHDWTKHFPDRPSSNPYGLEWGNMPAPFKRYPDLEPVRPPEALERLLRLGAGVHPRRGDPRFRTFMSAGALHPVELYVATTALWHFHPGEGTLRRLRDEDLRAALAHAAVAPELAEAAAVLILTGILWRTAWKYGARGWRHIFWDAGTMLANLLALADEEGLEPRLLVAFVDGEVAEVLGVEPPREEPVALLGVGRSPAGRGPGRLEPIARRSPPLSPRERRFEEAELAWAASTLATADDVGRWRDVARQFGRASGGSAPGHLDEVILRRGSARDFTTDPISSDELEAALAWACTPAPGDLPPLCSVFAVAHAVDGLEAGVYRFEPPSRFEPVSKAVSRRNTAHVCLDQALGGNAAAVLFFTADLDRVLAALGGRGYRAAQLDAGICSGRVSLGAYARGLGATGLTFYDDEVRRYLGTGEEPMMCVAVGVDSSRPWLRSAVLGDSPR